MCACSTPILSKFVAVLVLGTLITLPTFVGGLTFFRACGTLVKQAASVVDLINKVHYDFDRDGYDVHIFTHLLSLFGVRLAILLLFCCYSCFSAKFPHHNSHLFTMSHLSPRATHGTSWHLWALILSTWDLLPRSNSLHGDILCKVAEATSQQSAPPEKKEKKGKKKVNPGAMHCEGLYCRLVDKPVGVPWPVWHTSH